MTDFFENSIRNFVKFFRFKNLIKILSSDKLQKLPINFVEALKKYFICQVVLKIWSKTLLNWSKFIKKVDCTCQICPQISQNFFRHS